MKLILRIIGYALGVVVLLAIVGGGYLYFQLRKQLRDGGKIVEWNDSDGTIYHDLRYGAGERCTFDLILPSEGHPSALLLFIHGGSWTSGQKEDMYYEAYRYAKQGYATATINYVRLGDPLDYGSGFAHASFSAMMEQITMAIQAIKREGEALGCNFTRMAIGGYSAGGHLAMLYATRHASESAIPISFQISWVGPADMPLLFPIEGLTSEATLNDEQRQQLSGFMQSTTGRSVDGEPTIEATLQALSDSSPVNHVTSATPPAILVYGGEDGLVVKEHGERMAAALEACGVEHQLFIFPNSGHELGRDPEYTERVNQAVSTFCKRYL